MEETNTPYFNQGYNISLQAKFETTITRIKQIDPLIKSIQLFLTPRIVNSWNPYKTDQQLTNLANSAELNNVDIFIHAPYCTNMGWDITTNKGTLAYNVLKELLRESVVLKAKGVIFHVCQHTVEMQNSGITENQVIDTFYQNMSNLIKDSDPKSTLILETGSGKGNELLYSIFDFGRFLKKFSVEDNERLKICVDTAHIFGAGLPIHDTQLSLKCVSLINDAIGWGRVVCIHLNDSKAACGSKKDLHADLGTGLITWNGILHFLYHLRRFRTDIPIILETKEDTQNNGELYTKAYQLRDLNIGMNKIMSLIE